MLLHEKTIVHFTQLVHSLADMAENGFKKVQMCEMPESLLHDLQFEAA